MGPCLRSESQHMDAFGRRLGVELATVFCGPPRLSISLSLAFLLGWDNASIYEAPRPQKWRFRFYCLAFFGTRGPQKLECAINCLGSVFGRRQLSKIWLVFSLINAQLWNINYTCVRVLNLLGGHFLENLLKTNSRRDSPFFLEIYAIVFMC